MSVSPPGLKKSEKQFVEDIINFWKSRRNEATFKELEITLLRNLPKVGIGFFKKSGFYPDFILWIKNKKTKEVVVRFIDPHGMHHGGLPGNIDKIEALKDLQEISKEEVFDKKKVRLEGFILTNTELSKIPGAEKLSWEKLKSDYGIVRQEGEYCEGVLGV